MINGILTQIGNFRNDYFGRHKIATVWDYGRYKWYPLASIPNN